MPGHDIQSGRSFRLGIALPREINRRDSIDRAARTITDLWYHAVYTREDREEAGDSAPNREQG